MFDLHLCSAVQCSAELQREWSLNLCSSKNQQKVYIRKMAEMSSRKCFFFNIGYCKYKDKGCKNLHPAERCVLPTCTKRDCPKRHQKLCRYKESCKFQKDLSCEYLHKRMVHCDNENEKNISTDQAKQLKQVT